MKPLLSALSPQPAFAVALCAFLTACGTVSRPVPVAEPGTFIAKVAYTGSMFPTFRGGEYVVVVTPVLRPFAALHAGSIVLRRAPNGRDPIIHRCFRLIATDRGPGWITEGDAATNEADRGPMLETDYLGTVRDPRTQRF